MRFCNSMRRSVPTQLAGLAGMLGQMPQIRPWSEGMESVNRAELGRLQNEILRLKLQELAAAASLAATEQPALNADRLPGRHVDAGSVPCTIRASWMTPMPTPMVMERTRLLIG